jgi:two-component system response regulator PilR (NtrC family)
MRLPDGNGVDLVRHIDAEYPHCPVAVITAYGNTEVAVESLKAGAFDFVSKPLDVKILRRLVDQALKLDRSGAKSDPGKATPKVTRLLGKTKTIRDLRATIAKLARSQAPIYVSGESGTGKELVARTIHGQGPRSNMPFVPVNCGAIPAELMESEFFGHVKGAFTGAARDKDGLFVAADGGTLFLDEIAELPLQMQVKLLRAIQERAVRPVGSEHEIPIDTRIICATHKPLAQEVTERRFREDLYYRLNVIEVRMPSLREHADDIPILVEYILEGLTRKLGLPEQPRLTDDALTALHDYHFPGNVRELENILERAVTLCEKPEIGGQFLRLESPLTVAAAKAEIQTQEEAAGYGRVPSSLEDRLEEIERQSILEALEATRHNKTKAAQLLGISFRALRYRLKKLGIE